MGKMLERKGIQPMRIGESHAFREDGSVPKILEGIKHPGTKEEQACGLCAWVVQENKPNFEGTELRGVRHAAERKTRVS
jgi:hypothetical protein